MSPELTKIRNFMFNYIFSHFILLFISQILVIGLIVFYLHFTIKGIIGLWCTTGKTFETFTSREAINEWTHKPINHHYKFIPNVLEVYFRIISTLWVLCNVFSLTTKCRIALWVTEHPYHRLVLAKIITKLHDILCRVNMHKQFLHLNGTVRRDERKAIHIQDKHTSTLTNVFHASSIRWLAMF